MRSVALGFLCLALAVSAGDNKKADAEALLKNAASQIDIFADPGVPFQLKAHVKAYGKKGAVEEGTYQLWWNSADQWREEFRFVSYQETAIHLADKIYVRRNVSYRPSRIRDLKSLISLGPLLRPSEDQRVGRIKERDAKRNGWNCVEIRYGLGSNATACFDHDSGKLRRYEVERPVRTVYEFADYAPLGEKIVPRNARFLKNGEPTIGISSIEIALTTSPTDLFEQPPGSDAFDRCEPAPRPPGLPNLGYLVIRHHQQRRAVGLPRAPFSVIIYAILERDGSFTQVSVAEATDAELAALFKKEIEKTRVKPLVCQGKPIRIQYSSEFTVEIR